MTTATPERATTTARRGMEIDDLLRFTWIADPQISPDGTRVAFTHVSVDREADDYRTSVWTIAAAGGEPRALTQGERDRQPRWSPDGRRLAFVRSSEAGKPGQLWVLPMDGGEATQVTTLEKGVSSPAWSPDGRRIAFLSGTNPAMDAGEKAKPAPKHEPGRVVTRPVFRDNDSGFIDLDHLDHVWVADLDTGTVRALTCGTFTEGAPRWSPDGRRLLFASDRRAEPWFGNEESCLWAVDADRETATDGDGLEKVVDYRGPIVAFTIGADGAIACIGRPADRPRSYDQPGLMLQVPGGAARDLAAAFDLPVGESLSSDQHAPRGGGEVPLAFAPDGASVIARIGKHGAALLARFPFAGEVTELTAGDADLVSGTATPDGRRWALVIGGTGSPGDLYVWDAGGPAPRRLWGPNDAVLAGTSLGEIETFWYDAHDGRRVQGWLVKPPGFDPARRWPMILEIHGGPHAAYGWSFFHEFQVLAAAGYLVLYTNPRGSTTYGAEFGNVIQHAYPGDDAKDLMKAVDVVIARGYVDETRLGVTGGSGGGLLTNWLVAHTHRFAAAVTQRCVSDWLSMVWSSDFTLYGEHWFAKQPHEDPSDYQRRSPVHLAANITTPLMIIHSEDDWRTPIGQGEAMFRALKSQRKTTIMVRFPGESHELSRSGMPSRRVQNQQHIRAWFDHFLMGVPAPQYGL